MTLMYELVKQEYEINIIIYIVFCIKKNATRIKKIRNPK